MEKSTKLLYKTGIPRGLYGWMFLPITVTLVFWALGMHLTGAAFYGLVSVVIYLASNPDFCRIFVYDDAVKIIYYRPFNRTHTFSLENFQKVRFQRGELFHALPFLFKPVRLNDYVEFIANAKKDRKISINVKCNRDEAQLAVQTVNMQIVNNSVQ